MTCQFFSHEKTKPFPKNYGISCCQCKLTTKIENHSWGLTTSIEYIVIEEFVKCAACEFHIYTKFISIACVFIGSYQRLHA